MADNLTTQSAAPATPPADTLIATREATYAGSEGQHLAPTVLVTLTGSDNEKVATDVDKTNPLPVTPGGNATATITRVESSASSVQLLAANADRRGFSARNDDANTLLLKFGSMASAEDYTVGIPFGGYYEMPAPIYEGRIDGIWEADGSGGVQLTELT